VGKQHDSARCGNGIKAMFKNNVLIMAGTTIFIAVIAAFVFVQIRGGDTTVLFNFLQWMLTVVPIIIVGLVVTKGQSTISSQVSSVGTGVTNVEAATNGKLTERFDAQTALLKEHVDNAIASIATQPVSPPPDYTHTENVVN
jgi:hypothetical protein